MKATDFSSTINFTTPTENVQAVVTLLISNHIPFTLTSTNNLEAVAATNEQKQANITDSLKKLKSPTAVTIESIYQKYFEEIGEIPPVETQIAAELGMPLAKFKSAFKALYGKPFYQVYMGKRMEHAAKLLKQGYKCNEVAIMVGYGEKSAIKFNKMFQKHFGITPKKYQMSRN